MNLHRNTSLAALLTVALVATATISVHGQDPTEDDYFKLEAMPIPSYAYLEAGGLEMMPDGRLAVSSRRGDIYMVHNPKAEDLETTEFELYAASLEGSE